MSSYVHQFRLKGIRSAKTLVSSAADIAGDWLFYSSIIRMNNASLDKYTIPLLLFCIISSIMGLFVVIGIYYNFFYSPIMTKKKHSKRTTKYAPFGQFVKFVLGSQMFVEDIPQFVLTIMITRDIGELSTTAVFNFTTSGLNLIFNFLNMIEIEEHHIDDDDDNDIPIGRTDNVI